LNDPGDVDTGTNGFHNCPDITSVAYAGGSVTIDFDLDTAAGDYRVEFFSSSSADDVCAIDPRNDPACLSDGNGTLFFGEGDIFLDAIEVTHAGMGPQTFQAVLPMSQSQLLTATCTHKLGPDAYGATSEFSRSVPTTFP